jgi:Ca2+-binding EF-hand superfamily protein
MKQILLAAALIFAAGAAQAQMWAPNPDLDKDGKVTLSEFQQTQAGGILRLDVDKDGKLTRAETKVVADRAPNGAAMVDRIWGRLDTNKDGVITRAEIDASSKRRFEVGDTNKDGWLSKDEIQAMRQHRGRDAG